MNITNYFLLSIFYFWASSTALSFGVGYFTVYRPVIAGFLTGLILGDPYIGMTAGAIVNIIYIDFVSTGGSFRGDQCLTAIIAAFGAILFKLSPVEASAAAYPIGFLGLLIWKYRLKINSIFVKKYEHRFNEGKYPNISLYDGLFPQLLLYFMSAAVIIVAIFVMIIFKEFIYNIKSALYLVGIFLIFTSTWNIIYKISSKKGMLIFGAFLLLTLLTNLSSYYAFFISVGIIFILSNKKLLANSSNKTKKNSIIRKRDLIYSWLIWKNFSHSCYSYDRLQGMAYAHSMKNIFQRLLKNKDGISKAIYSHSEFFNTEPNMGTPIHGYIISLEESKILDEDDININFLKKGMMGAAAGLGDSYTQVVLTPLFVSMSVMLSLDNKFIAALLPVVILAFTILTISYTGFMKGYYDGRESLIERINIIKNSKVKLNFPYIFSGILGVSLGKLLMLDNLPKNLTIYATVGIISIVYTVIKIHRSLLIQWKRLELWGGLLIPFI